MIKHLWPLDLTSVEEGDIGKQWLLHSPMSSKGLALASSL